MEKASSETIKIVPSHGVWIPMSAINPPPVATLENAKELIEFAKPLFIDSTQKTRSVRPIMPATTPTIDPEYLSKAQNEIAAPIKGALSPANPAVQATGYRSGARSAVIPCKVFPPEADTSYLWVIATSSEGEKFVPDPKGTVFIRLKGCGMWLNENQLPFPGITSNPCTSRYAEEGATDLIDIRGVAYPHTSCTEEYVASVLQPAFEHYNLLVGNYSLGFWIYGPLEDDPYPLIPKSVSIFKTLGDRRLESHLLLGLERFINSTFSDEISQLITNSISELYPNKNFPSEKNNTLQRSIHIKITNIYSYLSSINDPSGGKAYENISEEAFIQNGFAHNIKIFEVLERISNEATNEKIKKQLKLAAKLAIYYGELGWEVGKIIGILHRKGYLWGTYVDHDESYLHCNAHCDNFVVIPTEKVLEHYRNNCAKGINMYQLLAPVDFDMAFSAECAISTWDNQVKPDPSLVTVNFSAEVKNLSDDLGGLTALYPDFWIGIPPHPKPRGEKDNLTWLYRDIAYFEFYHGYQFPAEPQSPYHKLSVEEALELTHLALNQSLEVQS